MHQIFMCLMFVLRMPRVRVVRTRVVTAVAGRRTRVRMLPPVLPISRATPSRMVTRVRSGERVRPALFWGLFLLLCPFLFRLLRCGGGRLRRDCRRRERPTSSNTFYSAATESGCRLFGLWFGRRLFARRVRIDRTGTRAVVKGSRSDSISSGKRAIVR